MYEGDHDWRLPDQPLGVRLRERGGVGQPPQSGFDLVEPSDAVRVRDDDRVKLAAFPRLGVFDQSGSIRRRFVQRFQITDDRFWRSDALAEIVAHDLFERGNVIVVLRPWREFESLSRSAKLQNCPKRKRDQQTCDHYSGLLAWGAHSALRQASKKDE